MLGSATTEIVDDARAPDSPVRAPFRHIALLGNALPRKCGLATYSSHLAEAVGERFPGLRIDHYAMDDGSGVTYPPAIHRIRDDDPQAYRDAARRIEASGAELLWVQHEYGIFGGEAGGHLAELVEQVRVPMIVTLHTVLENPDPAQAQILGTLLDRARLLVVMAESGADVLRRRFGVSADRIAVIPHGVPDRPRIDPDRLKPRFGLAGRDVLMTFGLLSRGKGIEQMIEAMPAIVARHPNALYMLVGATHPHLVAREGEAYRHSLERRVAELGVAGHVRFVDRFVDQEELLDLLQASDVYVTPYLNMEQVTSGTLAYAAAVGKAIVSTPYVHARELLGEGRGALVAPGNSEALAKAIHRLLDDSEGRQALERRMYDHARSMLWPVVAASALYQTRTLLDAPRPDTRHAEAPAAARLPLGGVRRMSDSTGILQHSALGIPHRDHGYCIDDNARALILAVRRGREADDLAYVYAAFVNQAWNAEVGRFRNFMAFDRRWLEESGSEDSNGRALWALGVAGALSDDPALRDWARRLYDEAIGGLDRLHFPRALAMASLGAFARQSHDPGHPPSLALLERTGRMLEALHRQSARNGWDWYEGVLAYDNPRLCEAHIRAGQALGRGEWVRQGIAALNWLKDIQTGRRGQFRAVGCESFGRAYQPPAPFDQQPLEAQAMVDAAIAAFEATGDPAWAEAARWAFGWFVGDNDLGLAVGIASDGSCFDGLTRTGVNRNQGAESILAFQLSALSVAALPMLEKATTRAPALA